MLEDVPRILNQAQDLTTPNDVRGYASILDVNKDGRICRRDMEKIVLKYLS